MTEGKNYEDNNFLKFFLKNINLLSYLPRVWNFIFKIYSSEYQKMST